MLNIEMFKKSLFFINLLLVIFMIISLAFGFSFKYFFYLNIFLTFLFSYLFFTKSKSLSKMVFLTNLFILFYFISTTLVGFVHELLGFRSYFFLLGYNVILGLIFIVYSGYHKTFFGKLSDFRFSLFFIIMLVGFVFSFFFLFVREPVSGLILDVYNDNIYISILLLSLTAFFVALSEQIIFLGFFYNVYKSIVTSKTAILQSSLLFVLFHLINFSVVYSYYKAHVGIIAPLFMIIYILFLSIFILSCFYFYLINSKKYKGNFIYPVILHFSVDVFLFLFYYFRL